MRRFLHIAIALSAISAPAVAETYLKGAKNFTLSECVASPLPDPRPLPETVRPNLDTRPECRPVVRAKTPQTVGERPRKARVPVNVPVPIK